MRYETSEIRFNLLALVGDKKEQAEKEVKRLKLIRNAIQKILGHEETDMMDTSDEDCFASVQNDIDELLKESIETIQASLVEISNSVANNEARILQEQERQARWKSENERRRHNYVPFIFELLQQLAKKNMLGLLFKEAVEAKKKKQEEKKAKKATAG